MKTLLLRFWLVGLIGWAALMTTVQAQTPPAPSPIASPATTTTIAGTTNAPVKFNLPPQIDLNQFIKIMSAETNTMFVYREQALSGKMSVISPPSMSVTAEDAFFLFERLLESQGLTMVRYKESNVVEIIPSRDARFSKMPLKSQEGEVEPPITDYVMRLIRIRNADINRIKATISPIFSKNGTLLDYPPLDLLIIVDTKENSERIAEIVETLDVAEPADLQQQVTLYRVRNTAVEAVHQTVSTVYSGVVRSGRPENIRFMLEKRMNGIFVIANQRMTKEILGFLEKIDVPDVGGSSLTIYELRFAAANTIAPLLSQIFGQPGAPTITAAPSAQPAQPQPAQPAQPQPAAPAPAGQPAAPGTSAVKILTIDAMNALVVIASPETTREILALIKQLDVERGDVRVVLHPLKFASATVLAPMLANIFADQIVAGKDAGTTAINSKVKIIAEPRLNALLIIADRFAVQRILGMVGELDVAEGDATFHVYRLKFASATRIAGLLNNLFGKTGGSDLLIIPETRLNALLIHASEAQKQRILGLVEQLDISTGTDESNFKLYQLQYAVATELAKLLKEVTGSIVAVAKSEKQGTAATPAQPAAPAGQAAPAAPAPATNAEKSPEESSTATNKISISADEATNALLVFAPSDVFPTLDRIIAQVDVRRLQVYIEALITEVKLDKSLQLGIDWSVAMPNNKGDAIIAGGFPSGAPLTSVTAAQKAAQSTIGVVGGGSLKFNDQTFLSFGAFIQAAQQDNEINILANPQLLMLNNQESTINVSTVVPVATNEIVDANGRRTNQIEFRDVGVILTIRPQISGNDSIRLEIKQNSSDISEQKVGSNDNAVTTLKRELKTTVLTADDTIVVLGGLINERANSAASKIPGLGDLPLLGWLFSNDKDSTSKTNLLMFIRPKIIRTQTDLVNVTARARARYNKANEPRPLGNDMIKEIPSRAPAAPKP